MLPSYPRHMTHTTTENTGNTTTSLITILTCQLLCASLGVTVGSTDSEYQLKVFLLQRVAPNTIRTERSEQDIPEQSDNKVRTSPVQKK